MSGNPPSCSVSTRSTSTPSLAPPPPSFLLTPGVGLTSRSRQNAEDIESGGALTATLNVNSFGRFTEFVDDHLQTIRVGVGLVGLTAVLLIGRSVRLMKKFYSVSDIPEEFIRKKMTLRGKVRGHENGHLVVEYLPILRGWQMMKTGSKESGLPIHLAGVDLPESNLHHLVPTAPLHSLVWFRLLSVNDKQGLDCIVNRRKNWFSMMMVNEYLVRQGLAKVRPLDSSLASSPVATNLVSRLIKAELYAERRAKGIWAKPSLRERVSDRTEALKARLQSGLGFATRPFTAGARVVRTTGAILRTLFRRSGKTSR